MAFFSQLGELWRRLEPRARLTVAIAALLCIIGIAAFVRFQSRTGYAPLYTGLAAEDAGRITEYLKQQKIPYRLTGGGRVIEVPESRVYEIRIALAKEGLPAAGQIGFELFDRSGLPGTQFSNKVNFQRALQGELARTIGAMAEIAQARVHLVLPEENLFREQTKASACVVLTPRPGAEITREMTMAIAHLVASATPGVSAENVTIVDNTGRLLHGPKEDSPFGGLTLAQFEFQREYEDRLALRLQSMLDAVLGPHQSVVRVQAQFEMDSQEIKQETLRPVAGGRGLVASEKIRQEQYSGPGGRGGVAGIAPNIGLGGANINTPGGVYTNRDETREYQFSRETSAIVRPPGRLKSLTIAAIIDEGLPANAEQQVTEILSTAAGIDPRRGDRVAVQRMKMKTAELAAEQDKQALAAEQAERRQRLFQTLLHHGLSLAAAALIFTSVLMAVRQLRQPLTSPGPTDTESSATPPAETPPPAMTPPAPAAVAAEAPPAEELQEHYVRELQEIARQDPSVVADRLVSLLQERVG